MATSGVQPPDPEQHAQDALLPDPSPVSMLTGLAIGGGAKGLHEVLKSLQKAKGSGTTPG